jgi:hypothetical protein
VIQNLVLNNSDHNFSVQDDGYRVQLDQTRVQGNPGSAAAVRAQDLAALESGSLTSAGQGIHVDRAA